ncbi:MAG TPA: ATP-binding protein [Vicinamibacteria bacterium]|nr:ATP-binding protein [Vicinamibacteria bacterium]
MASRASVESSRAWGGWLRVSAFVAVVAAAVAGWWSIASARKVAVEGALLAFENAVAARARILESRLAAVRSDLIFLAGSAPLAQVDFGGPSVEAWREVGAESAVLLFLRGHPEVVRVAANSSEGTPVFHAGRRGGVPLLWVARNPTGLEGVAVAPGRQRLLARVAWREARDGSVDPPTLEIEVEPSELLLPGDASWSCELQDASGAIISSQTSVPPGEASLIAYASIEAQGWSAPSPWRLACEQPELAAMALVGPLVERYRTTLLVAPVVIALTLILAFTAVQESRRRERIEAGVREEARTRALEHQLFHAERLATVGRLAAGIAHEINNPLEGMSNWLSLARRDLEDGRIDEVDGHLARVKEGLERAAAIVRQVLAHAEPSDAPHSAVDLHEVIRDTSRLVQSRKEFRGISFELDFASGSLLVRGNRVTLGQVALNLLLNACEVQPNGGEVRVSTRCENGLAVAEFADRGQGVPEADRERIFEPFFTTKSSTGLGLSICHGIVKQHQGELAVFPREGGGSVFRLALPTH